jgi:hypothetical protein
MPGPAGSARVRIPGHALVSGSPTLWPSPRIAARDVCEGTAPSLAFSNSVGDEYARYTQTGRPARSSVPLSTRSERAYGAALDEIILCSEAGSSLQSCGPTMANSA